MKSFIRNAVYPHPLLILILSLFFFPLPSLTPLNLINIHENEKQSLESTLDGCSRSCVINTLRTSICCLKAKWHSRWPHEYSSLASYLISTHLRFVLIKYQRRDDTHKAELRKGKQREHNYSRAHGG